MILHQLYYVCEQKTLLSDIALISGTFWILWGQQKYIWTTIFYTYIVVLHRCQSINDTDNTCGARTEQT